ncbi:transmembrane channel-like protein 7 isoform X2 [Betta splendens]|uniref:Transmembrane channel-like protein n=1 Tax=Betta splendens TaxID=158456 RepID=A0A9W2XAQ8_BETSP|nr:transmembrane channel-like protein 7 isoform X2 [Betta splendens]
MEEQNTTHMRRLLSEESTCSDLSSDYEYYQTDIYELLPSVQASRAEQSGPGLESSGANQGGPGPEESHGRLVRGQTDKGSMQPLKSMPVCIQAKRDARERRKMHLQDAGFWKTWWTTQSIKRRRAWEQMSETLSGLLPWQHTLHVIEGRKPAESWNLVRAPSHAAAQCCCSPNTDCWCVSGKFGVGVKAYFVFFRYLICLNLLHCAMICGFILGPTALYGSSKFSELLQFRKNDSVLNFFDGTGYLNRSLVFHAFYTPGSLASPCLNTPLLYLAGILGILLLSLIMVVRRTTVGYKHTWMLGKGFSTNVSYKIFCGWDFTIQNPEAAILKHGFIRNDLKLFLEEQSFSLRVAQRTLCQRVRLYLLRFVLNMLVLCLLGGAFSLIYFAIKYQDKNEHWLISLFFQYLPPITISLVNLVLPKIFSKISSFEDYSFTMQVNITLVRSIFLKLVSLGIYLFFHFISPNKSSDKTSSEKRSCIENVIGRDMYKLCIFNFLMTFCNTFFWNYPRKLVKEKSPTSCLGQLSGKQEFLIPLNVLDLVNIQTVFWVGVYHSPLLPLIGLITLVATFYMKKFTVLRCCVAEQRLFQGSNASVLFHFMLLLGLLMAAASLGFHFFLKGDGSTFCGPFSAGWTVHNVTQQCVESLPGLAQNIIHFLASEVFALTLILAEIIVLTSYVSRGRANQRAIDRLKDMLVMSSSDKRFLVKQHTTMQRHRRTPRCAAEDPFPAASQTVRPDRTQAAT